MFFLLLINWIPISSEFIIPVFKTSETEDTIPVVDEFKVPEFLIILLFSPKIDGPSIVLTVE